MDSKKEVKVQAPTAAKPLLADSANVIKKHNPYSLVYYRNDWSESKTEINNAKYWTWEIENNGFRLP
jgi:hypothetical protein